MFTVYLGGEELDDMSDQLLVRHVVVVVVVPDGVLEGVGDGVDDLPHVLADGDQGELEAGAVYGEPREIVVSSEVNPHLSGALLIEMSTIISRSKTVWPYININITINLISESLLAKSLLFCEIF